MEETNEIEIVQEELGDQEEETSEVNEKPKEVNNEKYFTDEMHKSIFPFQEAYRSGYGGGKAVTRTVKLSMKRK